MGSCAAPSAKGDDKFITTDYLQQCPGESKREILRALFMQKLPDILVLFLLFVPASSRRFFRLQ
jgi:hypothetical protein